MGDTVVVTGDPTPEPPPEPIVVPVPGPDPAASIVHADLLALREEITGRLDKHEERFVAHESIHAEHTSRMDSLSERIDAAAVVPEPEPEPVPEPAPAVVDDPTPPEPEAGTTFWDSFKMLF